MGEVGREEGEKEGMEGVSEDGSVVGAGSCRMSCMLC